MKNLGLVIQARMASTRLPGKVLMKIRGKPILLHILERIKGLDKEYKRIIITSTSEKDNEIEDFCKQNNILCFRGSEEDVLDRYYKAAKLFKLNHIVRLTGDNPLVDTSNLKFLIREHLIKKADYSSNKFEVQSGLPVGVGAEVFTFSTLKKSWLEGKEPHHREHVNEYILENPEKFKILKVKAINMPKEFPECKKLILTVDTKKNLEFVERVIYQLESKHLEINIQNICKLKKERHI